MVNAKYVKMSIKKNMHKYAKLFGKNKRIPAIINLPMNPPKSAEVEYKG